MGKRVDVYLEVRKRRDIYFLNETSACVVRVGYDLNLTQGCHKFYYLAPFAVFDSFSHPFLPCQCLFTFCVVWRINLRTVSPKCYVICELKRALYGIKCILRIF